MKARLLWDAAPEGKIVADDHGSEIFLLKAVDPFFRKGDVTELPIKITGTREHPSFGLIRITKKKRKNSAAGEPGTTHCQKIVLEARV